MTFGPRSRSILYSLVNASTHNLNVATSNLAIFQVTLMSQSSSYTIFSCKYISSLMLVLKLRFLDLNLSIKNGVVSSKIYDKRDDFNFEIVNFPFLDGDVPRSPSYGVYISQLIRFASVCSNGDDFNNRNLILMAKLFIKKQG